MKLQLATRRGNGEVERSLREDVARLTEQAAALTRENGRWAEFCERSRQFVDNVSHEFRTPLTVIKDSCSLLHDGLLGPLLDEQKEYLRTTLVRVDNLACLVDDMLDISKLEAGQLGIWRRSSDLVEIVAEVERLSRRRAASRKITLEVQLEPNLPRLFCDPENIQRVLLNLVINAIKFTPPNGRVTLWAKPHPNSAFVHAGVTDNGPGIAPEKLALLFERFQQAGFQPRATAKGFGLGLNIARELTHLNFGTLDVDSSPGHGATFSFTVPIDEPSVLLDLFLDRLGPRPDSATTHLITATSHLGNDDGSTAAMIDEFLQASGRTCDFVYSRQPGVWLLALGRAADDAQRLVDEATQESSALNRNRPNGKLPEIAFRIAGVWDVRAERAAFAAEFLRLLTSEQPPRRSNPQVLLVDDELDVLRAISVRLRAAGYDVIAAQDGHSGMAAAVEHRPDAIVLDVCMPDRDGFSVLSELRRDHRTLDIPVVMLSASVRDQHLALERGARFFIPKPYDSKHLLSAIQTTLKGART